MPFSGRGRSNAAVSIAEVAETVCRSSSPARKSVASALTRSASERNSSAETCSGGIESSLTDATLRDNGTSIVASPRLGGGQRVRAKRATVFRLNAACARDAFRRNTAARVYAIEAAHNPEVAGSNPAPATGKGARKGAFRFYPHDYPSCANRSGRQCIPSPISPRRSTVPVPDGSA